MKKFWLAIVISSLIIIIFFFQNQKSSIKKVEINKPNMPTPTIVIKTDRRSSDIKNALFIPYWTLSKDSIDDNYDQYIYFGISATEDGIDESDTGFKKINSFLASVSVSKPKILTVKMLDQKINSKFLDNKNFQAKIASASSNLAKQYGFTGILLDFELKALSFENVIKSVTDVSRVFAQIVHENNLKFFMTIYGDTFYNLKPYDVLAVSQNTDGIYIMAYDFHKARGNPGPNFPFIDTKEGYDFKTMIDDFLKKAPPEKLTIVFGLFGYDWIVDQKGESINEAKALSFNLIKQKFLDKCDFKNCEITKDKESEETKITYTDKDGQNHIVWFEDANSVLIKENYAKSKGISSFASWAYSYF